jgi:RNA polymerase sigma-70 factor (ECF subfamily)
MSKTPQSKLPPRSDPEQWVDAYGDYLYRYAMSRTQDPMMAEELVQEAFLAALRSRTTFEGRSSERTWLTGILKHKIIDAFRRRNREQSMDDSESMSNAFDGLFKESGSWKHGPSRWKADPESMMERKDFWAVFYQCLEALSRRLAKAFTLREMEGLSTEEICKVLNVTATNCWVMLYRARMSLRRCLETNWFSD